MHYSKGRGIAAALVVFLVPILTLGLAAGVIFAFVALFVANLSRRDAVLLWCSVAVNFAAVVVFIASLGPDGNGNGLTWLALAVTWGLGSLEGLALSIDVFGRVAGRRVKPAEEEIADIAESERKDLAYDPALRISIQNRERRKIAREILADSPALAAELKIGRPDLVREFVDGGLIDITAVPAWVLVTVRGITDEIAERIVAARTHYDGIHSCAQLVVYAAVPSEIVDALDELLIFT